MIGKLLDNRYRIKELLGKGGFGHTYLAEDIKKPSNPPCVVKHLKPKSNDPEFLSVARRLFAKEAEILEKLSDLDQVPTLYAYFEEEEEFYLVQEFIDGHPLSQEMGIHQPWEETKVIHLLQSILSILVVVHGKGVIHRDIKPDNIIRRKSDRKLVLIDFGAVKQVLQNTSGSDFSVAIGTSGFMPPEQAQGKPKFASDIYALGMLAIQALTGVPPSHFGEDTTGEIKWQMCVDLNLVSPDLIDVLEKMVRRDYMQRYARAEEVLRDLNLSTLEIFVHSAPQVLKPSWENLLPPITNNVLLPIKIGLISIGFVTLLGTIFIVPRFIPSSCTKLSNCSRLPQGTFRFSGGTSWNPIWQNLEKELKNSHPKLIFSFITPLDGQPSSGKGIEMLRDGEVDFALISRPLEQKAYEEAKARGIELHQEKIGIGALAVAVNPGVEIKGLTLEQIRDIYLGKVNNWQKLGGNNLPIKPIIRPTVLDSGAKSILGDGIRSNDLSKTVIRVKTPAEGIKLLEKTPGGIFWSSLGIMSKECNVKIIPIGLTKDRLISPVKTAKCPHTINAEPIKNGNYAVSSFMWVVYNKNDPRSLEAGTTYIKLLKTKEGREIFNEQGFISLK